MQVRHVDPIQCAMIDSHRKWRLWDPHSLTRFPCVSNQTKNPCIADDFFSEYEEVSGARIDPLLRFLLGSGGRELLVSAAVVVVVLVVAAASRGFDSAMRDRFVSVVGQ